MTTTRDRLRHKNRVRQAAMTLDVDAAWRLWPANWHAVTLPQYCYAMLEEQCSCATRQHRKKDCNLDKFMGCRTCGAAYEYNGEYPEHCPGCRDWHESRMEYLGEWALAHDDRPGRQMQEFQISLLASAAYDWSEAHKPRRPFLWSHRKPTFVGNHGECQVCGNPDGAPTSFIAQSQEGEEHVRKPVCTPCIRLGNTVKLFEEGPIESIDQLLAVIEGRNQYGFEVHDLREEWVPVNERTRNEPDCTSQIQDGLSPGKEATVPKYAAWRKANARTTSIAIQSPT